MPLNQNLKYQGNFIQITQYFIIIIDFLAHIQEHIYQVPKFFFPNLQICFKNHLIWPKITLDLSIINS